ncbi:unnamed protein product [Rotaria sp. Silwood1]|nr:unnamed protein product [Rotaria sp. Silwood1]
MEHSIITPAWIFPVLLQMPNEVEKMATTFLDQIGVQKFPDKIDTPVLEIRDLAMGICCYGIFANKLYGAEEDVKFMFVSLIQRCDGNNDILSQAMDKFYDLSSLIEAF